MPGRITSSAFIGRADELQNLLAVFEATRTAPAVVLLGGEAGVGKTRLVNEFSGRIPEARVLVGACLELGQAVMPLAPLAGVLRQLSRTLDPKRPSGCLVRSSCVSCPTRECGRPIVEPGNSREGFSRLYSRSSAGLPTPVES